MRFLVICVNYESYDSLHKYLLSIKKSALLLKEGLIEVCVVDNTAEGRVHIPASEYGSQNLSVRVIQSDNIGYFPAVQLGLYEYDNSIASYRYIIVSNVDLQVSPNFFSSLSTFDLDSSTAVIAPSILSLTNEVDINPKISRRPSRFKLELNRLFFLDPALHRIMVFLHNVRVKRRFSAGKSKSSELQVIYAAHGSFMVFTENFFRKTKLEFPLFLFGEEIYVAELCRSQQLRTLYWPSLRVLDDENVSTSRLKSRTYCKLNVMALSFLINRFF